MLLSYQYILLLAGLFIILNLIASRFAARFGTPTLLATLVLGMAFGNGGNLDFEYNYPSITLRISEIALCIIIFTGGFESNWKLFRPILWRGISLATLGVVVTMFVVGVLAHGVLDWPWMQSLLLGAVVSATDAAAVFSIMENSSLKLKSGVRELLEFESGVNDPMAFFLTVTLTGLCLADGNRVSALSLAGDFVQTMAIGLGTGILAGKFIHFIVSRIPLKRGQFPIVLLAWVLILYAVNSILGGSVFLAVYASGLVLGNSAWVQREININFFESLSWLMETSLFLILGLQVYVSDLRSIFWEGILLAFALIVLARPIGVGVSLAWARGVGWREKLYFAWVGLRGATPIVFALIPVVNKVPDAAKIFNISFVIVIASIIVQGTTVVWAARAARLNKT